MIVNHRLAREGGDLTEPGKPLDILLRQAQQAATKANDHADAELWRGHTHYQQHQGKYFALAILMMEHTGLRFDGERPENIA